MRTYRSKNDLFQADTEIRKAYGLVHKVTRLEGYANEPTRYKRIKEF